MSSESTIPFLVRTVALVRTAAIGCAVLLAANHAQAVLVTYNFTFTLDGVTDFRDVTGLPDTLDHLNTTTTYSGSATLDTAAIPTESSDEGTYTTANYSLVDLSFHLDAPLALDQPRDNTTTLFVINDIGDSVGGDLVQFDSGNFVAPPPGVVSNSLSASVSFRFPLTTLASEQPPATLSLADADIAEVFISLTKAVGSTIVPGAVDGSQGGYRKAKFTVTSLAAIPEPSAFLYGGLVAGVVSLPTLQRRRLRK